MLEWVRAGGWTFVGERSALSGFSLECLGLCDGVATCSSAPWRGRVPSARSLDSNSRSVAPTVSVGMVCDTHGCVPRGISRLLGSSGYVPSADDNLVGFVLSTSFGRCDSLGGWDA